MSAQVILFPKRSESKVTEIELLIRGWLAQVTADDQLHEYVVDRMKTFLEQYVNKSFEPVFNLPALPNCSTEEMENVIGAINAGVDNAVQEINIMVNKIIVERFFLEIENYRLLKQSQMLTVLK